MNPSGSGTVTSNIGSINCAPNCSASVTQGSQVILTATAKEGFNFAGWQTGCSGSGRTTSLIMSSSITCTAKFTPTQPVTGVLLVNIFGDGTGLVTSNDHRISCPPFCGATYPTLPTTITLTAAPDVTPGGVFNPYGSVFGGFTGCDPSSDINKPFTCSVTLSAISGNLSTVTISAVFDPLPFPPPLSNQLTIGSLELTSTTGAGPTSNLMVNGTGFAPGQIVQWNGKALPTTFVNVNQLRAAVATDVVAALGEAIVTVWTAIGTSAPVTLAVPPVASIGTINAESIVNAADLRYAQFRPANYSRSLLRELVPCSPES